MTARSVAFAVAEEDVPVLDELVAYFGGGNRSEFLRQAMKRMRRELWADSMRDLQARTRTELGGKVFSREDVDALVKRTIAQYA